jgi:UDPglucose 6-dehydrogenase
MRVVVVGTGYVGLVTGACFAEVGNTVTCVDIDPEKVLMLNKGQIPIHEPGLDELVSRATAHHRLFFTESLADALQDAEVVFIAVGTPPHEDGSADLTHVLAVASQIGQLLSQRSIVVDKSTVPVGTADRVRAAIQKSLDERGSNLEFDVVSNPEFLKEGMAIEDFMKPDRIVIGTDSDTAVAVMRRLYAPFMRNHERMIVMGLRDAELTKYAANAMLATKISFMNEIAGLCERVGADVEQVRRGIGSDTRIGFSFIYPGAGYGGSCFPKDVKALMRTGSDNGISLGILAAVEARNERQKRVLYEKASIRFGKNLQGKVLAIWGLAFKPGTDDIREAPSLVLIELLLAAGAKVMAYDPVASGNVNRYFDSKPLRPTLVDDPHTAANQADALFVVTEWKEFREPNFPKLRSVMRYPIIFDGRNLYQPDVLEGMGFEYYAIGRVPVTK